MLHGNESEPLGNLTCKSSTLTDQPATYSNNCPERIISHRQVLVDNLPYVAMILLGAAIFITGIENNLCRWLLGGFYLAYGTAGAFWIMIFVCPYCHFYDTRLCPCGYGIIASKLRAKKDGSDFPRQFKKHVPVIVPLWFIPVVAGGIALAGGFSWILLGLMIAFTINSYAILPLVSKQYGCASCPQKETCPWMGCRK